MPYGEDHDLVWCNSVGDPVGAVEDLTQALPLKLGNRAPALREVSQPQDGVEDPDDLRFSCCGAVTSAARGRAMYSAASVTRTMASGDQVILIAGAR